MKEKSIVVEVDKKRIGMSVGKNRLKILFDECTVELAPNSIDINCSIDSVFQWLDGKRKYLYIKSNSFLKSMVTNDAVLLKKPVLVNSFLINRVSIELGDYLIIVTPGSFSYDRIILYSDVLTVEFTGRKLFKAHKVDGSTRFLLVRE